MATLQVRDIEDRLYYSIRNLAASGYMAGQLQHSNLAPGDYTFYCRISTYSKFHPGNKQ